MLAMESRTSDSGVDKAVAAIRGDAMLPHFAFVSDVELTYWCASLQSCQEEQNSVALNQVFYELGKSAAAHTIPLSEMFRALSFMLNPGRTGNAQTPAVCKSESSEQTLAQWNSARYYVIRGYQDRLR